MTTNTTNNCLFILNSDTGILSKAGQNAQISICLSSSKYPSSQSICECIDLIGGFPEKNLFSNLNQMI